MLPAKKGCSLEADCQQVFGLSYLPPILFRRLRLHIVTIRDRIEMREDELANASLLCHLTALPGVQMGGPWTVGWEGTIEHGHVGILAQ
jgi:hypothetical protein